MLLIIGLQQIELIYSNIIVDEYIIMPNHIHMILAINKQYNNIRSKIIQQFKGKITKEIGYSISKNKRICYK